MATKKTNKIKPSKPRVTISVVGNFTGGTSSKEFNHQINDLKKIFYDFGIEDVRINVKSEQKITFKSNSEKSKK